MDCVWWVVKGRKEKTFKKQSGNINGVESCCIELDYLFLKQYVCCIKEWQYSDRKYQFFFLNLAEKLSYSLTIIISPMQNIRILQFWRQKKSAFILT